MKNARLPLSTARPPDVAAAVLAVLSGANFEATAAERGIDPDDLIDAVQIYHTGGLVALDQRTENEWHHVRAAFPDWMAAEEAVGTHVGPRLDELHSAGALAGWWFLRKHPYWRLRLRTTDTSAVADVLDGLVRDGALSEWRTAIYEPEVAAFGGPIGMRIAHDLFCADSRGVLDYVQRANPGLGRREISLVLISALQQAAGLDWFERGDVFDRVAQLRPAPPRTVEAYYARILQFATQIRPLLAAPATADHPLFAAGGPVAFAQPWLAAYIDAGHRLQQAAADDKLHRGVRAIITHIVIFSWNRLGLSASTQSILARAACTAILPPD